MMPLEEEVQVLSRVEILEPLSEEDLRGLLRRSSDTHLEAGETFFTPEDTEWGTRRYRVLDPEGYMSGALVATDLARWATREHLCGLRAA
jgi:hypothetical protein